MLVPGKLWRKSKINNVDFKFYIDTNSGIV